MANADVIRGAVQFFGPYDRPSPAGLKLRNDSRRPVIFRLKCSKPFDFNIHPSGIGLLRPSEIHQLTLTALPTADRSAQATFVLEYTTAVAEGQIEQTDAVAAWNNVKVEELTKTGLKVVFGPDTEEVQTTVVVIQQSVAKKNASVAEVFWRLRRRRPGVWNFVMIALSVLGFVAMMCGVLVGWKMKRSLGVAISQEDL